MRSDASPVKVQTPTRVGAADVTALLEQVSVFDRYWVLFDLSEELALRCLVCDEDIVVYSGSDRSLRSLMEDMAAHEAIHVGSSGALSGRLARSPQGVPSGRTSELDGLP